MARLNEHMSREYWPRFIAPLQMRFGFELGVLLQCDFAISIIRNHQVVYKSENWVMDAVSVTPSQLTWSNDAETFGSPMPAVANQPCSITFLTKEVNPLFKLDWSVGDILSDLYRAQFNSETGLLALPTRLKQVSLEFSLLGTSPNILQAVKGAITHESSTDQLQAFPLFVLEDVKLGTPEFVPDPKSMNPMGVKVNFVYRNTRWRDFSTVRSIANVQSDDNSIHTVKLQVDTSTNVVLGKKA